MTTRKWDKEETAALNEMFVGNWQNEANEQNAQIYLAMSIDTNAKIRIYTLGHNKKVLADQLRSVADRIEKENQDGIVEHKFDLN